MSGRRVCVCLCTLLLLPVFVGAALAQPIVVARAGTASIAHDADAGTYIIAASGTSLTLALDASRDFVVMSLATPRGASWSAAQISDTLIKVGGRTVAFGNRADGFALQNVATSVRNSTVRLDAVFDLTSARLRVARHYEATSGSPTFETWTTFTPLGGAVSLADLNAFRLVVSSGRLRWLTGLQGDEPNHPRDTSFT